MLPFKGIPYSRKLHHNFRTSISLTVEFHHGGTAFLVANSKGVMLLMVLFLKKKSDWLSLRTFLSPHSALTGFYSVFISCFSDPVRLNCFLCWVSLPQEIACIHNILLSIRWDGLFNCWATCFPCMKPTDGSALLSTLVWCHSIPFCVKVNTCLFKHRPHVKIKWMWNSGNKKAYFAIRNHAVLCPKACRTER